MEGSDWDFESVDDVLLLPEAHWTFFLGFSLFGLGDVQEAGLEDSMEGLVWSRSWEKLPVRARARERGDRTEAEASREERKAGRREGQGSWSGGDQRSIGLCLVLGMPVFWLLAAGEWHS